MNKTRKKQEDRLLKRLPMKDRRRQEEIRKMIYHDQSFKII